MPASFNGHRKHSYGGDSQRANPQTSPSPGKDSIATFWCIWNENQEYLKAYGRRVLNGTCQDLEDLLGTLMLKAHQKYKQSEQEIRNPKAWLTKILFNLCMDWYRSKRTAPEEPREELLEVPSPVENPETQLLEQERRRIIMREISRLPAPLRRAFVLRILLGWNYGSIASRLDLSACNARKRVQLARARLQKSLATLRRRRSRPGRQR